MNRHCPYRDCAYADLPDDALACPACGRPVYGVSGRDDTALIVDRARGFTGRGWAFAAIDRWLADPHGERVFLLAGPPGSGKTALAARLVQVVRGEVAAPLAHGRDPGSACANLAPAGLAYYHFCRAHDDDSIEPVTFVKSLSLALAARFPAYARELAHIDEQHPEIRLRPRASRPAEGEAAIPRFEGIEIGSLPAATAFAYLVTEPLKALASGGDCGPLVILVDALDEALAFDPQENIAALLAGLASDNADLPPQLRLLLTTQPDPGVLALVGRPALDLVADAPPDVDDVYLYVAGRLAALPEPARTELSIRLATAADGNMLYARYALDHLLAREDDWAERAALALPVGLDGLYRQVIGRELARTGERWTERFAPLLGLLAAARSPGLTRDHLAAASGLSPSRTDDALAFLAPFVAGEAPQGPFMLYHPSLLDFLLRDPHYRVYPADAEQTLGELFVRTYGEEWADCADDYAARHTAGHLARAAQAMTQPLQRPARRRLSDALDHLRLDYGWLQAKLQRAGVHALLADLALAQPAEDAPVFKIGRALEQGAYVLADDPTQLAPQLLGRLLDDDDRRVRALLAQARARCPRPCLLPCTATLRQGAPLRHAPARHTDRVTALAIMPDGRRAISASADGTLIVWDISAMLPHLPQDSASAKDKAALAAGREPRILAGHSKAVHAVALTPDGRRAVSASTDHTLRVWDLDSGEKNHTLKGHDKAVTSVAVTPDSHRAISASADGTLKLWDLRRGHKLETLKGHSDWVTDVAVTPDGRRAVSASWDHTLRVWDLAHGAKLRTLKGHSARVRAVALTPDGSRAISASLDGALRLWDLESGEALAALADQGGALTAVAVTPDGRCLVCALDDALKVWDLSTLGAEGADGAPRATLVGHQAVISCLAVTADGRRVISGSWDGALKAWDLDSGACLATFHADQRLTACALSGDGCIAVVGDELGRVHILRWEE